MFDLEGFETSSSEKFLPDDRVDGSFEAAVKSKMFSSKSPPLNIEDVSEDILSSSLPITIPGAMLKRVDLLNEDEVFLVPHVANQALYSTELIVGSFKQQ